MVKTVIRYSKIYNFCFLRDYDVKELNKQWQLVQDCGKMFEPIHKKYIAKILKLIPKYTGVQWGKYCDEFIPIYIMSLYGPGFHQPLTLRIRKDPYLMLSMLIHELVHNNFPPTQYAKRMDSENCTDSVTFKILDELGIKDEKYPLMLTKFTVRRFGKKYKPNSFDVNQETIIKYLGRKK